MPGRGGGVVGCEAPLENNSRFICQKKPPFFEPSNTLPLEKAKLTSSPPLNFSWTRQNQTLVSTGINVHWQKPIELWPRPAFSSPNWKKNSLPLVWEITVKPII